MRESRRAKRNHRRGLHIAVKSVVTSLAFARTVRAHFSSRRFVLPRYDGRLNGSFVSSFLYGWARPGEQTSALVF